MSFWTLEISGRAVFCIGAENRDLAENIINDDWFREDLQVLESAGVPLWNGEDELFLRPAHHDEYEEAQRRIGASQPTDDPLDENNVVLLLVPVTDPTDDDFDNDDGQSA